MKKVALVFVVAVLVPSLVLAWLAWRSLRDQQIVLERQQALLCQSVTDSFAKEVNDLLAEQQLQFNMLVESLVTNTEPRAGAVSFDEQIRKKWALAEVGFCVTLSGDLLCPSPASSPEARMFCYDNGGFLANRESVEVYRNDSSKGGNALLNISPSQKIESQQPVAQNQTAKNSVDAGNNLSQSITLNTKMQARKVSPAQNYVQSVQSPGDQNFSKVIPAEAEFRQLIGDEREGMMARFLQNKLRLMFWHRLERESQLVYGVQLNMDSVRSLLKAMLKGSANNRHVRYIPLKGVINRLERLPGTSEMRSEWEDVPKDFALVVLDDSASPVASTDDVAGFRTGTNRRVRILETAIDLKRPLVATEIGEALPHWEVAAYLLNPEQIKRSARTIQFTLGALILVLVLAITIGSWLIARDINRQLTLARQKTDFVSNVSHELKTPLTSIRMFSELLAEGRVAEPEKQRSYLNIITAETARLTRLINNVLDFARMDRGEKKYTMADCDLAVIARETAETFRPHLESTGFRFEVSFPESPVPMRADRDAIAQVIVNLLSNAEKYSNGAKEISLEVMERRAPSRPVVDGRAEAVLGAPFIEVRVMDRGPGVARGCEEKIFEQFYRADDSLSSGVQGSGLGLTLARQIARAHGGEVVYEPREDGGSCFTLRLPQRQATTNEHE